MRQYLHELKNFFRKGDMVLLLLCLMTNAFGVIMIASATNHRGNLRYIIIQIAAACLGIMCYMLISSLDADIMSEHRVGLAIFNTLLLLLLIPFGTDLGSGNRSWLDFPFLPIDIQPAEICKITFIVIMASIMARYQSNISSWKSIVSMGFHVGLLVGTNFVVSKDAGVCLIFVFIFIGMAFSGGVSLLWFLLAIGLLVVVGPFLWNNFLDGYQRERFQVLWDPTIDPEGIKVRYHSVRSLRSLTGGGWSGQGLFQGIRTQNGELPSQHTDFIFSTVGEELGFLGCILVLIMELAIIIRCIQVGTRSPDFLRRLICFGAASALMFQVIINVGMCLGVTPVIGLTLPFISYGGSSLVTLYTMLGLVSGVHARPKPQSHERYIRPYRR